MLIVGRGKLHVRLATFEELREQDNATHVFLLILGERAATWVSRPIFSIAALTKRLEKIQAREEDEKRVVSVARQLGVPEQLTPRDSFLEGIFEDDPFSSLAQMPADTDVPTINFEATLELSLRGLFGDLSPKFTARA